MAQFLETFEWFISEVRQSAPDAEETSSESSPSGSVATLQLSYWTEFKNHLESSGSPLKGHVARPQKWMSFGIGRSYFETVAEISVWNKIIGASLQIYGPDRFSFFHQLHDQRADIEAELQRSTSTELVWGELPDNKICRIQLLRPETAVEDTEQWPQQHEWLRQHLEAIHQVFKTRIKALAAPAIE